MEQTNSNSVEQSLQETLARAKKFERMVDRRIHELQGDLDPDATDEMPSLQTVEASMPLIETA